jgi:hypothetical protein
MADPNEQKSGDEKAPNLDEGGPNDGHDKEALEEASEKMLRRTDRD